MAKILKHDDHDAVGAVVAVVAVVAAVVVSCCGGGGGRRCQIDIRWQFTLLVLVNVWVHLENMTVTILALSAFWVDSFWNEPGKIEAAIGLRFTSFWRRNVEVQQELAKLEDEEANSVWCFSLGRWRLGFSNVFLQISISFPDIPI